MWLGRLIGDAGVENGRVERHHGVESTDKEGDKRRKRERNALTCMFLSKRLCEICKKAWLPDGDSQILRLYVFGPLGFWTMAPLCCAAKFDPFLSLDCALHPGAI